MIKIHKTITLDLSNKVNKKPETHSTLGESAFNLRDYDGTKRESKKEKIELGVNPQIGRPIKNLGDDVLKYRYPWDKITKTESNACSLSWTLCPDVRCEFDVRDKKVVFPKLFEVLKKLKNNSICKKIISNYEYGEKGKEYGKLHMHGLVQFEKTDSKSKKNNREIFEEELLKVFNRRSNCKHKTLYTKLLRTQDDRDRYLRYLKKEQQCKIKTLCYIN